MVWDRSIDQYKCDNCEKILTEIDEVVQVQFGYLMDDGQSFESDFRVPDQHYHKSCYKTGDRRQ